MTRYEFGRPVTSAQVREQAKSGYYDGGQDSTYSRDAAEFRKSGRRPSPSQKRFRAKPSKSPKKLQLITTSKGPLLRASPEAAEKIWRQYGKYLSSYRSIRDDGQTNPNVKVHSNHPDRYVYNPKTGAIIDRYAQQSLTRREADKRLTGKYTDMLINYDDYQSKLKKTPVRSKKIRSTISKFQRDKGVAGVRQALSMTREKITQSMTRDPYVSRFIKGTVVLGTLGVVRGGFSVAEAILKPKQFVVNQYQAVTHPLQSIKAMGHEFTLDPVGTVAEYWSFAKTLNLVATKVKRSPAGRFVQEEIFIRTQPKEIRPYVRAIIKSSKAQEAINPYDVKSLRKVDFLEVKALNKVEVKALEKTLLQTDTVIFGSVASRALSKKKTPIPKDVDLATADVGKFNRQFMSNLPKKARSQYVVKAQKIYRGKTPIFDVKPISRLIPQKSIFTKKGYIPVTGYVNVIKKPKGSILPRIKKKAIEAAAEVPTQKVQTLDGIKLVGFGEQTVRKGLGTLQVLIEKNIRRAKDPQAFIRSLQIQLEALKSSKPKTILGRMRKKSKVRTISAAIKILTSKKFIKILEKKSSGLTKEYPIFKKIDTIKLKKVKKLTKAELERAKKAPYQKKRKLKTKTKAKIKRASKLKRPKTKEEKLKQTEKRIEKKYKKVMKRYTEKTKTSKLKKVKTTAKKSYLPKVKKAIKRSYIPGAKSRLPKSSKLPKRSRLPKSSKLPKRSRLPKSSKLPRPSKIPKPSKLRKPSKIPRPSKLPRSSKIPSRLPSRLPSKLPKPRPSKLPKLPPPKTPPKLKKRYDQELDNRAAKVIKKISRTRSFYYLADLGSIIKGRKATKAQKKKLLAKQIFTGLEKRLIV